MSKLKLTLIILSSAVGGIAIFIAGLYGYMYFKYRVIDERPESSISSLNHPKNKIEGEYLGALGITSGEFDWKNEKEIKTGKGILSGIILRDGKPCEGLKIRLLLNGNLSTPFATSQKDGKYSISIPYGEYIIDGWRIDYQNAHKVLDGKILEPGLGFNSPKVLINENIVSTAPSLNFIDPIKIINPKGVISNSERIEFMWTKVENAKEYRIQIVDRGKSLKGTEYKPIFGCYSEWPTTTNNSITIREMAVSLQSGHYYTFKVQALADQINIITESPHKQKNGFYIN